MKVETHFDEITVFTAREIQQKLDISESSAHRLLRWAADKGKLERLGQYNTVCYRRKRPRLSA